jgi:hypothetical protein
MLRPGVPDLGFPWPPRPRTIPRSDRSRQDKVGHPAHDDDQGDDGPPRRLSPKKARRQKHRGQQGEKPTGQEAVKRNFSLSPSRPRNPRCGKSRCSACLVDRTTGRNRFFEEAASFHCGVGMDPKTGLGFARVIPTGAGWPRLPLCKTKRPHGSWGRIRFHTQLERRSREFRPRPSRGGRRQILRGPRAASALWPAAAPARC